ncbi:leucine rich repeat protein, putative [Eimeria brunetti]|uniref:Leucine rich repeat protein, putative n=1 Tax=Eimeria brunetti TaxID=51314 RepID=U6LQA3_9EIME|nr:leucine rich repeat protein, putative [Eimeria brunetti]
MRRNVRSPQQRPGPPLCVKGVFSGALGNRLGVRISRNPQQQQQQLLLQPEWSSAARASRAIQGVVAVGCKAAQQQESSSSSSGSNAPCTSSMAESTIRSNTSTSLGPRGIIDRRVLRAPQRKGSQPARLSGLGCFSSKQHFTGFPEDPTRPSPIGGGSNSSTRAIPQHPPPSRSTRTEASQGAPGHPGNGDSSHRSVAEDSPTESGTSFPCSSPASSWRREAGRGDCAAAAAVATRSVSGITAVAAARGPQKALEGHAVELVAMRAPAAASAPQEEAWSKQFLRGAPRGTTEGLGYTSCRRRKTENVEATALPLLTDGELKHEDARQITSHLKVQTEMCNKREEASSPQLQSDTSLAPPEETFKLQHLTEVAGTNCGDKNNSASGGSSYCNDSSNSSFCVSKVTEDAGGGNGISKDTGSSNKRSSSLSLSCITYKLPVFDREPQQCTVALAQRDQLATEGAEHAESGPSAQPAQSPAAAPAEAPKPPLPVNEASQSLEAPGVTAAPDSVECPSASRAPSRLPVLLQERWCSNSSSSNNTTTTTQYWMHSSSNSSTSGSSSSDSYSSSRGNYKEINGPLNDPPGAPGKGTACPSGTEICNCVNKYNNSSTSSSNNSSSSCLDNSNSSLASQVQSRLLNCSLASNLGVAATTSDQARSLRSSAAAADRAPRAVRVLSALGAPGGGPRQETANGDGAESPVSSPSTSDNESGLRKAPAGPLTRAVGCLGAGSSAPLTPFDDISADLSWLYSVTGIRDASEANLVDTIELIMDRPLGPKTLGALGTFGCLRQLRLVQQQLTSLEFVGVCKNLQLLHLPENQIESIEDLGLVEAPVQKEAPMIALQGGIHGGFQGAAEERAAQDFPAHAPLDALQRLHTLRLNSNRLRTLRGVEGLANLRVLQVADNELTHVGAALSNNKKLEEINVAAN